MPFNTHEADSTCKLSSKLGKSDFARLVNLRTAARRSY
jgi:hypothetical protein